LAAATINLLTAKDSTLYKAAVTDNTGSYQFEKVKSGNYLVKIRSVNFTTWHSSKIDLRIRYQRRLRQSTEAINLSIPVWQQPGESCS
jgi:hypothetical protein